MLDLFKDRQMEEKNKFMLINLILKRTKQLSLTPYETPETRLSPQEIKKVVYGEITQGKIDGIVKDTKEPEDKKELKEVTLVETPREYRTKLEKIRKKNKD